jgi:hypothetical protein
MESKETERLIKTGSKDPAGPLGKIWNFLGVMSQHSEAATRELVYEHVQKTAEARLRKDEKYSESDIKVLANQEAIHQAKEILNFNRRGDSAVLGAITALAPFINARIQGMDVLGRAAFKYRTAGIDDTVSADDLQSGILHRGALLAGASMALAMLNYGDDDYENLNDWIKDDNWPIPIPGLPGEYFLFMAPFEMGFIFKTVPEHIVRVAMASHTGDFDQANRDAFKSLKNFALGTFGPAQAFPVVARPFYETMANKTIHNGMSIEPYWQKDLPAEKRIGTSTTAQARMLGSVTGHVGVSPRNVDAMIRTITGGLGAHMWAALDTLIRMPSAISSDYPFPLKPTPKPTDVALFRRVIAPTGRDDLTAYYEYRDRLAEAYAIVNSATTPGEKRKLSREYRPELVARKRLAPITKRLNRIRNKEDEVRLNEGHRRSAGEMRKALDDLHRARTAPLKKFKQQRKAYDNRG